MKQSSRPRRPTKSQAPPQSERRETLYGVHCCTEALRAGRRPILALLVKPGAEKREEVKALVLEAQRQGLPIRPLEVEPAERGESSNPQGVGLDVGPLPEVDLEVLAEPSDEPRRLVILDGVEDPQNVGALARVAEGAGVRGMILSKRRAPPLSSALARASAGAIEWLPVARVTNLARAIKYLKSKDFWIVGADLGASESLYEMPDSVLQGDLAVVMGAEGKGLRPEVQKLIDHPVRIDMQGKVASLNVSAAGAVLLFELLRRANLGSKDGGQDPEGC